MLTPKLFARNDEVAAHEATLPQLEGAARVEALILLAWHIRQRDSARSLSLVEEAEQLFSTEAMAETERQR